MFPFAQSSSYKVCTIPDFYSVWLRNIKKSRLRVKIATDAKETSPVAKLGSLALQADALPIELASPGDRYFCNSTFFVSALKLVKSWRPTRWSFTLTRPTPAQNVIRYSILFYCAVSVLNSYLSGIRTPRPFYGQPRFQTIGTSIDHFCITKSHLVYETV